LLTYAEGSNRYMTGYVRTVPGLTSHCEISTAPPTMLSIPIGNSWKEPLNKTELQTNILSAHTGAGK